jgi:hypothetical protein
MVASSHHSAAAASTIQVSQDFRPRAPKWALTQRPPMNISSLIYWVQENTQTNFAVATATVESNFVFQIAAINAVNSYLAIFDQYCIYAVHVRIIPNTEYPASGTLGSLATAIDYDNVNNLGSWTAIQDYGTVNITQVESGVSVERYIEPCVAPAIYNAAGSFTGFGVGRYWIDSANSGVPHYGLRTYTNGSTISYTMLVNTTYILGFRNTV